MYLYKFKISSQRVIHYTMFVKMGHQDSHRQLCDIYSFDKTLSIEIFRYIDNTILIWYIYYASFVWRLYNQR